MKEDIQLNDCAHCGGPAIICPHHTGDGVITNSFTIECSSADCLMVTYPSSMETVVDVWNRRDGLD